jgi:signal transduction histidine kinase
MPAASEQRILVVDDRAENIFALRTALAPLGVTIHSAQSGYEALALLLRFRFAALLLDVQMPEMNGFELASLIRGNPSTRNVPILFVTAISKVGAYVQEGYKQGAVDYLFKPLDPDILCSKVRVFLELEAERARSEALVELLEQRSRDLARANANLEVSHAEAVRANRAKSTFLATMTHELRTPLNAIIGYVELLGEEAREHGAPQLVADLGKVHQSATHLLTLISDILDISKIEAGGVEVVPTRIETMVLVQDIVAMVEPLAHPRHNTFRVRTEGGLGTFVSDRGKVRQIVMNLLGNAFKFTERGTITLSVEPSVWEGREHLTFTITDTGMGIPRSDHERVFEPFTQQEPSSPSLFGGTGLGLAISRRLARLLGGDITLQSELGRGSSFVFRVPRSP